MTRIIAGAAGGIRLDVPAAGTRPTSDRVRESLFQALEPTGMLDGTTVVDLFAGSGALGLESLSRGAAVADLVERHGRAARVARANADRVSPAVTGSPHVHAVSAATFLRTATRTYDLAFLDPPYDLPDDELAETLRLLTPRLSADALVIVERATRSGAPRWAEAGMAPFRDRAYGDTSVWWGEPAQPAEPDPSQSR